MANGDQVHITSEAGTDYYASIKGHKLFPQYGMVRNPGETCSPPDIEMASGAMPAPPTARSSLTAASPTRHGRFERAITIYVENSFVTKIEGGEEAKRFAEELAKVGDPVCTASARSASA